MKKRIIGIVAAAVVFAAQLTAAAAERTERDGSVTVYHAESEAAIELFETEYDETAVAGGVIYGLYGSFADATGFTAEVPEQLEIPAEIEADGKTYSVRAIADNAFLNCAVPKSITVSEGIESIGDHAFSGCGGCEELRFGASVNEIGTDAFADMTALEQFVVAEGNTVYSSPGGVLKEGDTLVRYPISKPDKAYTVPDGVTAIGYIAFNGSKYLESITMPESVTEIRTRAFEDCSALAEVNLGEGVTELYSQCFRDCSALKSIYIPKSVLEITENVFDSCTALESIEVDPENTAFTVTDGALYDTSAKTLISYPAANQQSRIVVEEGTKKIGASAFDSSEALKEIVIPESVTTIGVGAFTGCTFETIDISGVTTISQVAFQLCDNMRSITVGEKLEHIGMSAFAYCSSLEQITIPAAVTEIDANAFEGCVALSAIDVAEGNENYRSWDGALFSNDGVLLAYPLGRADEVFTIPAFVTSIDGTAFVMSYHLEAFEVEEESEYFTAVDGVLFTKDKKTLVAYPSNRVGEKYTIPEGTEVIAERAFGSRMLNNGAELKEVVFPSTLKKISDGAFMSCMTIEKIDIKELDALEEIGMTAFLGCDSLRSVMLPKNLKVIGQQAFDYCYSLEYVVFLGDAVEEIDRLAFRNCDKLKYVYVPDGSLDHYKELLAGERLNPVTMIVEGDKLPLWQVQESINALDTESTAEDINAAAEGFVRLTNEENLSVSAEDIAWLEELFTNANDSLEVSIANEVTELSVSGCALASGVTEGEVELGITRGAAQGNELVSFEAELRIDGAKVQPRSPIVFTVYVGEENAGARFTVTHIADDGVTEELPYTMDGNYLTFRAPSLSTFLVSLAEEKTAEITVADGIVTVTSAENAVLAAAEYSSDGSLSGVVIKDIAVGENTFTAAELAPNGSAKIFVWSDMSSQRPLCATEEL